MNKYIYAMVAVLIIAGLAIFKHVAIELIVFLTISILAVLAWLKNVNASSAELKKNVPKKAEEELFTGEEGEEYHNDFSKVPAGKADAITPPPRSIGIGYGDGGRSTFEDLERIGIKTKDNKKE